MRPPARWRRWAAITLSVCCCFLSVACAGTSTTAPVGGPPVFFMWNYNASVGATTPQEAYALSAHFTPCRMPDGRMTTSADQSVTWLVSGPHVGVAYLRATCRNAFHGNYLYRSFLEVVKGTVQGRHDAWYFDQFDREWPFPPTEDPTPTFEP